MPLTAVIKTIRPAFLLLPPVCVLLGLSTALAVGAQPDFSMFLYILIGAVCAHISVNALNEYADFKSGLDLKTRKTAFSGGSGTLPGNPELAGVTLAVGLTSLLVTILIGIYLLLERGMLILPFGIAGVVLIATYTPWINRFPVLCLVAPGLGFGVLMVVGTHVILTGKHALLPWLVSLVPFFLVNNLLLLNQYPDIQADASVGRKTFPIAYGLKSGNVVYAIFFMAAYALILAGVAGGYLPALAAAALLPVVLSMYALYGMMKHAAGIGEFPRYLAANVAATLLTPLLLAISIINGEG